MSLTERRRVPGAFAIGLRLQYMPGTGSAAPSNVDFGRVAVTDEDPFAFSDPFSNEMPIAQGDVFLTPANDLSFGANVVVNAMEDGADQAVWQQIHATSFAWNRWGLMMPMRLYLGASSNARRARVFTELGIGADMVTMRPSYDVVSITGTQQAGQPVYELRTYSTNTSFADGKGNTALFWNGMIGAGVEYGRFNLVMNWQRSFHGSSIFSGGQTRRVNGDPIGIALLNGEGLDEPRIGDELGAQGAIRFGSTGGHGPEGSKPTMERFLDRSYLTFSVSVRIF
jgi:hypothetical protein